jgi:hypothetical protein
MSSLISIAAAIDLVKTGAPLVLAGSEDALDELPPGNWVGGTIPYFMADGGGVVATDRVFVNRMPADSEVVLAHYGADELESIVSKAPVNGFSLVILPAFSRAHRAFAEDATRYPDAFMKPTAGWIAGVLLGDLGKRTAKVFDGRTATKHEDGAVVAHIALPASKLASIEIVNIFEPDDGDVLTFDKTGFEASEVLVNGKRRPLPAYLAERGDADCKLPLVGEYDGAHVTVSLQSIDAASGKVAFYAPVFEKIEYRLARPVPDYAGAFREKLSTYSTEGVAFSCNCILNFVYGELEGKAIGSLQGPVTFGEIGFQLLNQTLAVVRVS